MLSSTLLQTTPTTVDLRICSERFHDSGIGFVQHVLMRLQHFWHTTVQTSIRICTSIHRMCASGLIRTEVCSMTDANLRLGNVDDVIALFLR